MKKSLKKQVQKYIIAKVSANEMKYVEALVKMLSKRKGKHKAITNRELQIMLGDKFTTLFAETSIRKYINYIRVKKMLSNLIACSGGYYIAASDEEVVAYINSLQHRIYSIYCVMESYEI
jgi:uncharacterized protein (DUF2252 family)